MSGHYSYLTKSNLKRKSKEKNHPQQIVKQKTGTWHVLSGVGDLMKDIVAQSLKYGYTMSLCDTSPRSK